MAAARRPWPAVLAGLLLVSSLAGCASQKETYCSTLKSDNAKLQKLAGSAGKPGAQVLHGSLAVFEDLKQAAPPDIAGDWDDFAFAWKSLVDAFDAAHVDPASFDPEHRPAGVSEAEFAQIKQAAAALQAEPVQLAARRIEDHAQTICKVNLGGGGLGGL